MAKLFLDFRGSFLLHIRGDNMALIKHQYPILERDTEQMAIIMPNRKGLYELPEKCVFAFLGETTDRFACERNCEKIAEFDSITKLFPIYKTVYKSEQVCFCQAPCGASAATQIVDYLISYGVKYIIACGSCGTLHDFEENQIMIPTSALRDEGTSYHYIAPSRIITLNSQGIEAIKIAAKQSGINFKECRTWSTDGFFRETKELVKYRIAEGCEVVEMECSALAACAEFRNAVFGQILFTADTLANVEQYEDRDFGKSSHDIALKLSFEAVYYMDK